ncbi:MAG: RyR domain-containing protein [Candidatus Methylomirabilales bacterium]
MSYEPQPIDADGITLGPALEALTEQLARSTHDTWARQRLQDGWRYGPERDDGRKEHPGLVPYEELPDSEKEYDRRVTRDLLRALLALGYRLEPPGAAAAQPATRPAHPPAAMPPDLLQTAARLDLRGLLALWQARDREAWAASPEPYARLGERILRLGAPLPAHDVLAEGLVAHPADVRLRQLQALALARSGAAAKAHQLLQALFAEGHADGETLGILARTCKDLSAAAVDPQARRAWLRRAHERYGDAYRLAGVRQDPDSALYAGINAASTALLLDDRPAAQRFAREARAWCERRLARSPDYWAEATLAEAALILGDWAEAGRRFRRAAALGEGNLGDLASTRRQARLLLRHLRRDPGRYDACFRIGPVVVFAGHRLDRPGRPDVRFPPALAPAVAKALAERLAEAGARIGFASAASGADILFLEALLARAGEAHVVLPYGAAQFRADQADAGGDWEARHARVVAAAAEVVVASEQSRPNGSAVFAYAATLLYGWAKLWAEQLDTPLVPLAVWDGKPGDGPGGTAAAVARWRELGHDVQIIDLGALRGEAGRPRPPAHAPAAAAEPAAGPALLGRGPQTVMAVLFADAVGYSRLTEEQVGRFVEHFLGAVGALAARAAGADPPYAPVSRNTWGDGLYLVFRSAREAGRFALDLCDLVDGRDWTAHGLPAGLSLRVALHAAARRSGGARRRLVPVPLPLCVWRGVAFPVHSAPRRPGGPGRGGRRRA